MEWRNTTTDDGPILVIAAYPDDEILMSAGIIRQAVLCGIEINVVMVTNGDYEAQTETEGVVRLRECLAAVEKLGMDADHLIFMGYADTGMSETDSFIYRLYKCEEPERLLRSNVGVNTYALPKKPDWHFFRHGFHEVYSRNGFITDLMEIIEVCQPCTIFTHSVQDKHGDYAGIALFIHELLDSGQLNVQQRLQLFESIIHSCAGMKIGLCAMEFDP